ncbi:MAG: ArnT family glycosyltransferase [Candidatus Helarchaeota archaeon]
MFAYGSPSIFSQGVNIFKKNKIVILLLLLSVVVGLQYIFFTPPWQAPDETHHYEYIDILYRSKIFNIKQKPDYNLQNEIIKSMDKFNAWKYVFRERPFPLPKKLADCPLYGGSSSKINRPPLYYILCSFALKIFKINNLLLKHYLIRLFSLFISLFTIIFVYLGAKIVFNNDFYYSLLTACFVALLPQFMIISASINSDSLANMIGASSIYAFLLSLKHYKKYYLLLLFPLLIILGFLTGRTTFFILPSLIIFSFIYIFKWWKEKESKLGAPTFILFIIFLLVLTHFTLCYFFPDLVFRVVRNIMTPLRGWPKLFQSNFYAEFNIHFFQILFKSFWYCAGWMAFPFPNYVYNILKIFSLLSIIGFIKHIINKLFKSKQRFIIRSDYLILLFFSCFIILIGLLVRLNFTIEPMARYLFPALSAFAILFVVGLRELIPFKSRKIVLVSIISLFIVLNIYAIFHHLINVFYFYFW